MQFYNVLECAAFKFRFDFYKVVGVAGMFDAHLMSW